MSSLLQRHGMLCLQCVQTRLGRALTPHDYKQTSDTFDLDDPLHGPMNLDDYGILDELRGPAIAPVDRWLIEQVRFKPKKIRTVIIAAFVDTSGLLPSVELFYLSHIEFLMDIDALEIAHDAADFWNIRIMSAS